MFDTDMKLKINVACEDGKVCADLAVNDFLANREYDISVSGEDMEEVLASLYQNLVVAMQEEDEEEEEELTIEDYVEYLENKVEELKTRCEELEQFKEDSEDADIAYLKKYLREHLI